MATLIKPDGSETEVQPKNSQDFQLQELYDLIECSHVQMIWLADGIRTMWMDEESKLGSKPPALNPKATKLLREAGGIPWDEVWGNVLICGEGEVK